MYVCGRRGRAVRTTARDVKNHLPQRIRGFPKAVINSLEMRGLAKEEVAAVEGLLATSSQPAGFWRVPGTPRFRPLPPDFVERCQKGGHGGASAWGT